MQDISLAVLAFTPFLILGILSGTLFWARSLFILTIAQIVLCVYLMSGAPAVAPYDFMMTSSTIGQIFATIIAGQWCGLFLMTCIKRKKV